MYKKTEIQATPREIEQFIGIQMLMPIIELPSFTMYWTRETRYPASIAGVKVSIDIRNSDNICISMTTEN